jgi:hypothetical protein
MPVIPAMQEAEVGDYGPGHQGHECETLLQRLTVLLYINIH